jgi:hypothetical protein
MGTELKRYLWACWGQALLSWRKGAVIMTALISLALIAGLYLGWHLSAYPSSYFLIGTGAIAAFDVLAIFPFQLWKANTARMEELEESLQPKIRCSFDMNNPACVRPNTQIMATDRQGRQGHTIATWYRMKVEAIGHSQICSARLVSIKRADAELLFGETPFLPFAPMQNADTTQKLVNVDIPEFVDFLWTNNTHGARIVPIGILSQAVQWDSLFDLAGDYIISIVITHGAASPARINLKFSWTLDPITSRITVIP